jgi:ribosomal protein S18 acetylase RimI-like enzyme
MIIKIDKTNHRFIANSLEKYRRDKNKQSVYHLGPNWTENTLNRLLRGEIAGLYYRENDICRGFILFQVGKRSVFVSSLYIHPWKSEYYILEELICNIRDNNRDRIILITNPTPEVSVKSQSVIFADSGFEKIDRYRMDFQGDPIYEKVTKPEGVRLRKFDPAFGSKLDQLDAIAYRNQPDEVIMSVFRDILGEYPSLKLAKAGKSVFDSKLSNFAFIEDQLVGAIYCAHGRDLLGIANIAVDPKYQKMGIGTLLLDRTLRGIKKSLYNGCTLNVSKENAIAYTFYKKNGFKLKRFCPNFVYHLGQGVDTSAK